MYVSELIFFYVLLTRPRNFTVNVKTGDFTIKQTFIPNI